MKTLISALLMLSVMLGASVVQADTAFYLDPDVSGGTHVGTQANPFNTLDWDAWTAINDALDSGNVTVYCSARNASTDTNQLWDQQAEIYYKTANPTGTLTFDGKNVWNSNDSTPNWSAYSGASRCQNFGFAAQNPAHTKYNKVTIDGFVVTQDASTGTSAILICGDNWTIQNSDISAKSDVQTAPLIMLVPTADHTSPNALYEGTPEWCKASSNIVIQDNVIHDGLGESLYIGGGGCNLSSAQADKDALRTNNGACQISAENAGGVGPSHSNITIQRNTLYNCGSRGDQGDCIDMKAGLTNVTISQNDISTPGNNGPRCLVAMAGPTDGSDQNVLIERNRFHECTGVEDAAIAIGGDWGTPNGFTIRNNIIDHVTGTYTTPYGIKVYDSQSSPGVKIYSNTIYDAAGYGILAVSGTYAVQNNALLSNNGGGAQTYLSGSLTLDHNAYSNAWGGSCTSCVSGLTSGAFTNVGSHDFTLPANSALLDVGATIGSFSNDFVNTTRPQGSAWDIGAYER